jgi:hypothetical protein
MPIDASALGDAHIEVAQIVQHTSATRAAARVA